MTTDKGKKAVLPADLDYYTSPKPLTRIMISFGILFALGLCALVGTVYFYDSPLTRVLVKIAMIPLMAIGSVPVIMGTYGLWFGERNLVRVIKVNLGLDCTPARYYDEDAPDITKEDGWEFDGTPPSQNTRSQTKVESRRRRGRPRKLQGDESDK